MKKAVNLGLVVVFVCIAYFGYAQTVVSNDNGLFLSNNPSNSAKDFINATKVSNPKEIASSEKDISNPIFQVTSTSSAAKEILSSLPPSLTASESIATKTVEPIDEGALPLFSNKTQNSSRQMTEAANSFTATFSLFTSLIGIIILALAASWFIQKKTGLTANNFGKVLGIVPLDTKRFIYIVDVMGKMLVLGVTEQNITFLTEITDKDTIDAYRLKYGQSVTPGLDKLFPFLKKDNADNEEAKTSGESLKIMAEKTTKEIKSEIEENRKKRENRLRNMIIKKSQE